MIHHLKKRLRRLKRDYQFKVVLPAAVILIAARTLQCLIFSKLSKLKNPHT